MLEQTVLKRLITDRVYWDKVLPHIQRDYFESNACKEVFDVIDTHSKEYDAQATLEVVNIKLSQKPYHENMWEQIKEVTKQLKGELEPMEQQFLMDETQKWMKSRAVYLTIFEAVSIYEDEKRFDELGAIPEKLEDALAVGFNDDLGDEYWVTTAQHYENTHTEGYKIPFKSNTLNDITKGGAETKSLNAVSAGINVGKTTCLISLAADYLEQGIDVVYFSAEIAEDKIHTRFDPRITQLNFDQLSVYSKMEYLAKMAEVKKSKGWGRLFIKEVPLGTVKDCDNYLKQLYRTSGFKPKVMMFDYITEFTSYRLPITAVKQTDLYYGSVAREMRALQFKYESCGWTATQLQRGAQNTIEAGIDNTADSITIPKVLDFQLMVSVPEEYEALGMAHCAVNKSRYGDKPHFQMSLCQKTQTFADPSGGVSIVGSVADAKERIANMANPSTNHEDEKAPAQLVERLKGNNTSSESFNKLKT